MIQDRDKWWDVVNIIMSIQAPKIHGISRPTKDLLASQDLWSQI